MMDDGLKSKSDIKDEVGWTKRAPEIGLVCGPRFSGCLSVSALAGPSSAQTSSVRDQLQG
jgi:hypothetical protein